MHDISDVPELQEDMLAKANVYATMPVIIPNEVREGLGYDKLDDPMMDKPLIKSGYMTLEDYMSVEDLPITEDYANTGNSRQVPPNNGGNNQERNPS